MTADVSQFTSGNLIAIAIERGRLVAEVVTADGGTTWPVVGVLLGVWGGGVLDDFIVEIPGGELAELAYLEDAPGVIGVGDVVSA